MLALEPGMHGAAFFASGWGRAEEKFFGVGWGAQAVKSLGRCGVTVKLKAFLGQGGGDAGQS